MSSNVDNFMICNFQDNSDLSDVQNALTNIWKGSWKEVFKSPILTNIKSRGDVISMSRTIETKDDKYYELMSCAIASIFAFCEANWTGPNLNDINDVGAKYNVLYENEELFHDGEECYPTITYKSLLFFAIDIFDNLPLTNSELMILWWKLRCYLLYQQILDENCPRVFSIIEKTLQLLSNLESSLKGSPDLQTLLNIEMSQAYLLYGRVQNSEVCLQNASKICGTSFTLKGALGKRTKYQQQSVAQLGLDISLSDSYNRISADLTHGATLLLNSLKLNDDLRLEQIEFNDNKDNSQTAITSLEQALCLASVRYIERSQPKDELAEEELMPYLNLLLSQKSGPWSIRINAFLMKCRLESKNKRTVERAMMQCEQTVNNFTTPEPTVCCRLSYLWASGLPPYVYWKSLLGDLLLSIGLVKAALDIYLDVELWEEVIACYTILQLQHKAAEIIQQQIAIKPTAKLYCLLGDATDDPSQYQIAWDFSNQRSSKAKRHWGNYLFSHKKYEECIPHYEKSCEINSLQESVWLRLGYAALITEKWEIAANAYRRYTYLEPHSFEAWNNLAKVYVKQGNKDRAYRALNEALKYNYDNWRVWENMLIVSLDTGHFDDVVRSYNRILDLNRKHLDIEVLRFLANALILEKNDADGNPVTRLIKKILELFARLAIVYPTNADIWLLYADVSPDALLKGQRLLKAFSSLTSQNVSWVNDIALTEKIIQLTQSLASCSLQAVEEIEKCTDNQIWQLVSSARLSTQAVIRATRNQKYEDFNEKLNELTNLLQLLTSALQKR